MSQKKQQIETVRKGGSMAKQEDQINLARKKNTVGNLSWRQSLGQAAEQYVSQLLVKKGWQVIERNWRAGRYAEIDIIAYDPQGVLVFIEVKSRVTAPISAGFISFGYDKLDRRKIQKLLGCSRLYMAQKMITDKHDCRGYRFDAFIVLYPKDALAHKVNFVDVMQKIQPEIQHIEGFIQ